jgi:type I restriction enzyme R subunit
MCGGNNQAVYSLLRYGVPVKIEAGRVTETVHLIDWNDLQKTIAEEVTLKGDHERRPDIVLYVNGIAVGVLELKNSRVSIGDGVRQSLSNQQPDFNGLQNPTQLLNRPCNFFIAALNG